MANIYKSKKHGYVCEMWGVSTKHPDSIFYFDDFEKNGWFADEEQVFQWLLECASKFIFASTAKELVDQAMIEWYPRDINWKAPSLTEWNKDHWHENYR